MRYDGEVELVSISGDLDADGYVDNLTEEKTPVFADVLSVRRTEFYEGMKAGIQLSIAFKVMACDYSEQPYVDYNGKRYKIQRTYTKNGESLELNCSEVMR